MRRPKSVFVSWMFSYLLLLMVPILISALVYAKANKTIEAEVNRVNMVTLKQCQQAMDNGLQDVNKLIYQVGLNNNINQLMQMTGESNYYSKLYEIRDEFLCYKAVTGFVSDFYIYLPNFDRVLTPSGLLDNKLFYEGIWKKSAYYDGMSYEEWRKVVQGEYSGKHVALQIDKNSKSSNSDALVYTQTYPINNSTEKDATIIIVLDTKRFMSVVQNIQSLYNGWGLILDEDSQVLFSTGPDSQNTPLKYENLTNHTDLFYDKIDGQKVVVSYITSEVSHWKYVSVIPVSIFRSEVVLIRNLTMVSLILCLLLGAGAAYFFTRRNLNPINELIKLLEKKTKVTSKRIGNEFHFIQEVMNDTLSEREKIYEKLKQQDDALRSNFFQRLLKGKLSDQTFITDTLDAYNVRFDSGNFAVMLFYVTDFSRFFDEDYEKTVEEKLQFVQFIITNVVEELARQKNQGYMTEIDEMLACIINVKNTNFIEAKEELVSIAKEAQEFLKDKFLIDFDVSISDIHETILGIPEAHKEALTVMQHKTVMGNAQVMCYDDLKISPVGYHYPMETEYQLINATKSGDYESASNLIHRIFEDNVEKTALSSDLLRCFIFDLVSTILKTVPEITPMNDNMLLQDLNIVNRLLGYEKLQDMKMEILEILKEICDYIQQNKKDKKGEFIEEVIQYIQNNYTDTNLSVAIVAQRFNITPHYLTRIFKEKMGDGLFDYITVLRLEKAKELLKSQEYSIKDIAEMVGYYNSNVFIRAFKKHVGVTPGMFRGIN